MKNQFPVTRELVKDWVKDGMFRGPRLIFFIIYMVMGVFMVSFSIFMTVISLIFAPESFGLINVMIFLVGAFALYRGIFHNFLIASRQYTLLAKTYGGENWLRTVLFEDGKILLTEGNTSVEYSFSDVIRVRERGDMICLEMSNRSVLRIYRSAFVDGDWDSCRALLGK